jgi:pilus assembly protein Flp/PilA
MTAAIRKLNRQAGVTMIEYALIAALVGVAAITALTTLGGNITTKFTGIGTSVSTAGN